MSVWRWDKKEPVLRFPLKEQLSVVRMVNGLCLAGGKQSGRLCVWEKSSGQLIGEVENAHYLTVNDMDVSTGGDLVVTGGKDFKVKVWITSDLYFGGKQ